ncbi:hypothetical protein AYO21_04002 [Fonsecaea monophora]|uniref:Uncharacterized protein n=1 Tax=Fonsecaea monophora TaxID=254056 RepID=A0A177FC13_9EURO|nr:hypothetical protein AYO21_04002 [Fonsecaea monophora]OAG41767.1 hypothetical protein AYO21_04002 [Fonsecaea monophora]
MERRLRENTERELEVAQILTTFHLTAREVVPGVEIVYYPAGVRRPQQVNMTVQQQPRPSLPTPAWGARAGAGAGAAATSAPGAAVPLRTTTRTTTNPALHRSSQPPLPLQPQPHPSTGSGTGTFIRPSAPLLPGTPSAPQPHAPTAGTHQAAIQDNHAQPLPPTQSLVQRPAPYRYSCYACQYVSQRVGCVVNHMVNQHGVDRAQVDRARIEASRVQMLW